MKDLARITAALLLAPYPLLATDPPAAVDSSASDCVVPNTWVVGPRTPDRPLPLLSGDSVQGFRPACTLPWSAVSPKNAPLAIAACFRGGLLQIETDAVCGAGKGKLWISSRWVVTTAKSAPKDKAAGCQQLQTNAYAATRTLPSPCVTSTSAKR
jgi:hypothetical protein